MEQLIDIDTQLFYWINNHHCCVSDWILWVASQAWSWAIILIFAWWYISFYKIKKMKQGNQVETLNFDSKVWWILLVGMMLCFLLSDRISVMCFKDVFQRLRPCHALENVRMFRTTCGGKYGFISSHAANVFSLALFLTLFYRKLFNKSQKFGLLMFAWAIVVGYSRPYLGKHYPGDVICGAIVGMIIGWGVYWIISKIAERVSSKLGR